MLARVSAGLFLQSARLWISGAADVGNASFVALLSSADIGEPSKVFI